MYKTIIMPVDVFEMELSDKAVRHADSSPGMTELFIYFTYYPGQPAWACTVLPLMCVVLKSICNMETRRTSAERWSTTSPSILPALNNMSVLVACGMEVNELAEELGADVVVIGSRNPSISTHLLGS